MYQTIKCLIIYLILLPSFVFGQGATTDHKPSFTEKVQSFASTLSDAQKQLADIQQPELDSLLQAAPVRAETIDERIKQLDHNAADDKTFAAAQQYAERLQQTDNVLKQQQTHLDALASVVKTLGEDAQTLEQLLGNPVSKAELSPEEQQRLPQLLASAKQVIADYQQQSQTQGKDSERLQ